MAGRWGIQQQAFVITKEAFAKLVNFVILNEVNDLNLLKIIDSSLRSEWHPLCRGNFARGSKGSILHPWK
jgi:hypothetical protein